MRRARNGRTWTMRCTLACGGVRAVLRWRACSLNTVVGTSSGNEVLAHKLEETVCVCLSDETNQERGAVT